MMAMAKKILNAGKKAFMAMTETNTIEKAGGFSSLLVPRKVNGFGVAAVMAGSALFNTGDAALQARGRSKAGYVSYGAGLARMTGSYTSGVVHAMKEISGGNYGTFAGLAENVVKSPGLTGKIDDYGVTPQMISSLYHMGQ